MTCEECEQILLDSNCDVDGKGSIPGVSVMNLAKSHAQDCPACAAKMFEVDKMKDALDQLRLTTMHMEAPAAIEANLLAAFREMAGRDPSVPWKFPWKLVWGAAAALLLAALGVTFYPAMRSKSPVTVQIEKNHSEQLAQRQMSPIISVATGRAEVENHRPNTGRPVSRGFGGVAAKRDKPPHEGSVGRRSPTPAADELSLNGGGSIVRVTLPLSSLVAMGVPVHPDISDPRVTADVMMNPFGSVMAIRLVEAKPSKN